MSCSAWCMHPQMPPLTTTKTFPTIQLQLLPYQPQSCDFNLPNINWATLTGSTLISNNFCECIFESNLFQLVEFPTHTCGNISNLIFTNCPERVIDLSVHPPEYQCTVSDHYLVTVATNFESLTSPPTSLKIFSFTKGDFNSLTEYLSNCDLTSLNNSSDVKEIWNTLRNYLLTDIEHFIPKVRLHTRQFPTPQLHHFHKCLHTLKCKYIKQPTSIKFND